MPTTDRDTDHRETAASSPSARAASSRRAACVVLAVLISLGCERRIVHDGWEGFKPKTGAEGDGSPTTAAADFGPDANWAIAADVITGSGHRDRAKERVDELRLATGMAGFWSVDEAGKSTVYYGRYKSPQQPEAVRDLDQLRAMKAGGRIRADALMMLPLTAAAAGELGEFDLRRIAGRAAFTLQIGFYEGGNDARKAAQDAVAALRKQGAEAYYYHGPNRSMVTVGAFGEDAIVSTTEGRRIQTTYSTPVKALQERFPHNTANGRVIDETRQGVTTKQPSFLVRVPKPQ